MNITEQMFDKQFRKDLISNPKQYLVELGYNDISEQTDVKVKIATDKLFYFVMPSKEMMQSITSNQLQDLQAAKSIEINTNTVGTVASAGSLSSVASLTSTVTSVGCVGSASTAGTLKP